MPFHTYPYELPPLPYAYDALEPHIDAETMHLHHDRHFRRYVSQLNQALAPHLEMQRRSLEQLLRCPISLPREERNAILHNAGGVYNHTRFFQGLAPAGLEDRQPSGRLLRCIENQFSSFKNFKSLFSRQAIDLFGSGWTCLVLCGPSQLKIVNLSNQETALPCYSAPLLIFDVWEHAYYLKYRNSRSDYVNQLWSVLKFPEFDSNPAISL